MENNKRMLELCYQPVNNGYYVTGIYFSDKNMMCRFGEWLSVMNEIEKFYLYDLTTEGAEQVDMEEYTGDYDREEGNTESGYDQERITASDYAQTMDQD